MAKKPLPPTELLRQLLEYKPDTGLLYWRPRPASFFNDAGRCAIWNAKYSGKVVGRKAKYVVIKLLGQGFVAHRIIWKMVHDEEPNEIDHINRDKFDNRLANLRNVDHSANMQNKPIYPNNTSGHKHISWSKRLNLWVVQLNVPNKGQRQIAWEDDLDVAIAVRDAAKIKYGYIA